MQDDISALVPDARATTIFALVNALGRRDRKRSLQILDTLTRDGEYLPLALAFLSTQFRMALVSKETGLRSAQQSRSPSSSSPRSADRASAATRLARSACTRRYITIRSGHGGSPRTKALATIDSARFSR